MDKSDEHTKYDDYYFEYKWQMKIYVCAEHYGRSILITKRKDDKSEWTRIWTKEFNKSALSIKLTDRSVSAIDGFHR